MSGWTNKPLFTADFKRSSFTEAIAVQPIPDASLPPGSGLYSADLRRDWCIGFVPHGGYLTSLLLATSTRHITTHPLLSPLNQPHPIQISTHFFNSCSSGPARLTITPIKTGRQYTFLRVILTQHTSAEAARTCLEATIAHTHFSDLQRGLTLHTLPPPYAIPHRKDCEQWLIQQDPLGDVRPVARKLVYMMPAGFRNGSSKGAPSIREQWVKLYDGGLMDVAALGYLSDMYLPIPENYPETSKTNWYPTLSLSVEVKRVPPPETGGWEWLFCRIESREIRNGRMDVGVDIFDEERNLVAVAHQLAIIVDSGRNKHRVVGEGEAKL